MEFGYQHTVICNNNVDSFLAFILVTDNFVRKIAFDAKSGEFVQTAMRQIPNLIVPRSASVVCTSVGRSA